MRAQRSAGAGDGHALVRQRLSRSLEAADAAHCTAAASCAATVP